MSKIRRARARRARQRREGIVVLLLMLVMVMASGTAVFTLQSTQYEQRSSSAVGESNWARGLAECTAMAGIAYAEGGSEPPSLGAQWMQAGSTPAEHTQRYAFPAPLLTPGADGSAPNNSRSLPMQDSSGATAPSSVNTPTGSLAVFLPPNDRNRASPTYPLFADYDSQFVNVPGLRFYRAHWLQERLPVGNGSQRTRTVVTGFAEINVWNDPVDPSSPRGLHELDAISRGYIDTLLPSSP